MEENQEDNPSENLSLMFDVNFTLPLGFVQKLIKSKSKTEQTWAASVSVKDYCAANRTQEQNQQYHYCKTESTDTIDIVTTRTMRGQKSFVCICFKSVKLCSKEGKLDLLITSAKTNNIRKQPTVYKQNVESIVNGTERESLDQHDGASKRKRGRPCKTVQTASGNIPISRPVADADSTALDSNRPGYHLRGKKLPRSIFGDSGSDIEEEEEEEMILKDDAEYLPKCRRVPSSQNNAEDINIENSSTSEVLNAQEQAICATFTKNDRGTEADHVIKTPIGDVEGERVENNILRLGDVHADNNRQCSNDTELLSSCETNTENQGVNECGPKRQTSFTAVDCQSLTAVTSQSVTRESGTPSRNELGKGATFLKRKRGWAKGKPRRALSKIEEPVLHDGEEGQGAKRKRVKVDTTGLPSYARRKRSNTKKAMCRYCRRKFCDYTGVLMHVRKFHTAENDVESYLAELMQLAVVQCSRCDKQFDNRILLHHHEDTIHIKVGEIPCAVCGKVFSSLSLVKQHVRYVHQAQGQDHACALCPAKFKNSSTLKDHVRDVHNGEKRVTCPDCHKQFSRVSQFNRHARIHGPDITKLCCKVCSRKFTFSSNLQRHVAIVHKASHSRETQHCAYCAKGFLRKEGLHNHLEKVHFSLFPFTCVLCKAGFVQGPKLEKHMSAKHDVSDFKAPPARPERVKYNRGDEEGFFCDTCSSRFFFKSQLVQHIFSTHKDAFPYHCHSCPQVFLERSSLVIHGKEAHDIAPAPEDCHLFPDSTAAHLASGASLFSRHKEKRAASMLTAVKSGEVPQAAGSSYTIRIEMGNTTRQYLIHNPSGHSSIPSDAVVQNIAQLILSTEAGVGESGQSLLLQAVDRQIADSDVNQVHAVHDAHVNSYGHVDSCVHSVVQQFPAGMEHQVFVQDCPENQACFEGQGHLEGQVDFQVEGKLEGQADLENQGHDFIETAEGDQPALAHTTPDSLLTCKISDLPQQIIVQCSASGEAAVDNFHHENSSAAENGCDLDAIAALATTSDGIIDVSLFNSLLSSGSVTQIIITGDSHDLSLTSQSEYVPSHAEQSLEQTGNLPVNPDLASSTGYSTVLITTDNRELVDYEAVVDHETL